MQLFSDREGSVMLGWVGSNTLYSRLSGRLSAELGAQLVRALESAVAASATIRYFADARDLTSYDLLARSALARVLLSKRKQFADIVLLNWKGGDSSVARVLMETVGQPLAMLDDPSEFEKRLLCAAPRARDLIGPPRSAVTRRRSGPLKLGNRNVTARDLSHPPGAPRHKR